MVRHNLIRDTTAAPGIWLDWDNINCRVSQNTLLDVQNGAGAVFIEASEKANWVDHNVIWGIQGNGVYQHDTDELVVFNNLIGRCTDAGVRMQVCTQRKLNGREVTCKRNQVRDNILVDNQMLLFLMDPENNSNHNTVADSDRPDMLAEWQKASAQDGNSRQIPLQITLDPGAVILGWTNPEAFADAHDDLPGPFTDAALRGRTIPLFVLPHGR